MIPQKILAEISTIIEISVGFDFSTIIEKSSTPVPVTIFHHMLYFSRMEPKKIDFQNISHQSHFDSV